MHLAAISSSLTRLLFASLCVILTSATFRPAGRKLESPSKPHQDTFAHGRGEILMGYVIRGRTPRITALDHPPVHPLIHAPIDLPPAASSGTTSYTLSTTTTTTYICIHIYCICGILHLLWLYDHRLCTKIFYP